MQRAAYILLRTFSALGVVLVLCCQESTKPVQEPSASPPVQVSLTPSRAAAPQASAPQASADLYAAEYAKAKALLDEAEGVGATLRQAREILVGLVGKDKNYAPAYVGLARLEYKNAYINYDNYEPEGLRRARKLIDHAIKLDPKLHEAHLVSAWIWIFDKEFDLARQSIERADEIKPGHVDQKILLMKIAEAEDDLDQAERLAKSIVVESTDKRDLTSAYSMLTKISQTKGDFAGAVKGYEAMLKLNPDSAWTHGNYASFLLRNRRVEEAVKQAERAVSIRPYPMGISILAKCYVARANELWEQQRQEEASQYLDKLVRMAGDDPEMYYQIGVFYRAAAFRYQQDNLLPRAEAMFAKAVQLRPEYKEARGELDRLRARRGASE